MTCRSEHRCSRAVCLGAVLLLLGAAAATLLALRRSRARRLTPPPRRRTSRGCAATPRVPSGPSRRCRSTTTSPAPGSTRANRSPTCGPSPRRSRPPSAWPTSRTWRPRYAHELHVRLIGLRSYLDTTNSGAAGRHLHEHAGRVRRHGGSPRRARRGQVLRRQRLGRDRAGAAVRADPQPLGARAAPRRSWPSRWPAGRPSPELGCPGGLPFSNASENTDRNTITTAPAAELAAAALPRHPQRPVSAVRRTGLRMGAPLPAAAERAVRRPRQPPGRGRTDALELHPGHDDRRRHAALPGDRQRRLPRTRRARPRRPRSPTSPRNGSARRTRSSRRSTSATCSTSTRSPTTRPARRSPRPTSTTPGSTCACATTCSSRAPPPTGQLLVQAAIVQIYALLSSPPSTYF